MIFAPEAVDKGLRKYAKSGKNVAEESVERVIKNNFQESSEAAIKRGIKNSVQESAEAAIKREIKKSDRLVEASTGIRFADNIDDFRKVDIPELPKNELQKNFLEVTRAANNAGSGVGGKKVTVYHYTDKKGYNGITSDKLFRFKVSQPAKDHPRGVYLTTKSPEELMKMNNGFKKLGLTRSKSEYFF